MERRPNYWTKIVSMSALAAALAWGKDAHAAEFNWCRSTDLPFPIEQLEKCEKTSSIKVSLESDIALMKSRVDIFSQQDIEDVEMYRSMWMEICEKYELPSDSWIFMWVNMKAESTVSRNTEAFVPGKGHFGAFQRSVAIYPDARVKEAASGLEALANLPQRHPSDWREGAFFVSKIKADMEVAVRLGSENPLLDAQTTYIGRGPEAVEEAHRRFGEFLIYREILAIN